MNYELIHAAKVAIDRVAEDKSESVDERRESLTEIREVLDEHFDDLDDEDE